MPIQPSREARPPRRADSYAIRPFVLCVDIEPAERQIVSPTGATWSGTEEVAAWLETVRRRLAEVTGSFASFSWYLRIDPQIDRVYGSSTWVVERFRPLIDSVGARGDALGVHPHFYRWQDQDRRWYVDNASEQWMLHGAEMAVTDFRAAVGCPPAGARMGDRFLSDAVVNLLERLGVGIDLTAEPGYAAERISVPGVVHRAPLPDSRGVPPYPYRPSRADVRRSDGETARAVWMLPVTTSRVRRRGWRTGWRSQVATLNFALPVTQITRILDACAQRSDLPVVVGVMRSGDASVEPYRSNLRENLRRLADHPLLARCRMTTPAQAIAHYEATRRETAEPDVEVAAE